MKNKKNKLVEASFIVGLIVAMFFVVTNVPMIPVMENGHIRSWRSLSEEVMAADPGTGKSGVVNVSLFKHGLFDYGHNVTSAMHNTSWYNTKNFGETNNTEIGDNVPYGIKFDIVVKVVWNRSMMYNVSSKNWTWSWVNATMAVALLGYTNGRNLSGEWNISQGVGFSNDERVWAYYVFGAGLHDGDTGGAALAGGHDNGLSINKSQRIPTCYFRFFAYY